MPLSWLTLPTNGRQKAPSTYQALIDANHARLRPILMTTIAMVIGMLPIALAKGAGARVEEWTGLGDHRWVDQFTVPHAGSSTGDVCHF